MLAITGFLTDYRSTFAFGLIYGIFALATYTSLKSGVLSVAAVTFGAVSGFMYGSLHRDHGLALQWGLLLGAMAGAAAAFVLSLFILRLSSHYIALATIALVLITRVFVLNLKPVTGGANGMFIGRQGDLWWILGCCAVCMWMVSRLDASRFGLAATVVHEDPQVASSLGINTVQIQRIGLVLSGVFGGIGGVLMADQLQFIGPNTYYVDLAFTMLAAVVLGGAFHWFGAFVGAMVFRFIPELLTDYVSSGHEIANGILLVIIMIYLPRGLVDPSRRRGRRRTSRSASSAAAAVDATATPEDLAEMTQPGEVRS